MLFVWKLIFLELLQKAENMTHVNNSFSLCRKKKVFKLIADQQLLRCLDNPMNPLKKTIVPIQLERVSKTVKAVP